MLRPSLFAVMFAVAAVPALADVSRNPQSAPKGKYKLEPNHTGIVFCIRHMGISDYCGRFTKVSGTMSFTGAQPEKSSADITIDTTSVDTPSSALNDKLKAEFLETAKFPTAGFKTTSVKVTGNNEGEITGNLTLHGVTKPLTLKATFNGGTQHPLANTYAVGFSAMATFKHSDFNFPDVAWRVFIGDEVTLYIETEFLAEK